ncbi:MAG: non-canonical purine NTP diphosphatase [Prevotella ruminicola]|jgi:non-canonical purine NTP pyrophosphatase (RdgB/HAM1 family)|uniref:dITP/XTP pyrophosphatase n=1 Tax=Xylanibacter ruminicola TaxID=839 RepID=A0A9D5NY65_XYLRU|nr:non-canonical purine NTP diphosphatase [Xylanibacter ruminicola]
MTIDHKIILNEVKDYMFIALGLFLYTIAFTVFLMPYQIVAGGVTGLSAIIYYATGFHLENTYIIINGLLLIVALKILGYKFLMKTIFAIFTLYFMLRFAQDIIPKQDNGLPFKLMGEGQDFMSMIIGCVITGIALATVFLHNGSTGGTDIIAASVNKYHNVSLGSVLIAADFCIIGSCMFFPQFGTYLERAHKVMFGFCVMAMENYVLDYVMNARRQSVQFFIFSRKWQEIANAIGTQMNHGVTILDGHGWYTGKQMKVLCILAKKNESVNMFRLIKMIDPNAFVSQSSVIGVYGEGFDEMKVKIKKEDHKKVKIVFATNNLNKLTEVRKILGNKFQVMSLAEIGCNDDIPEKGQTLKDNALIKAQWIYDKYHVNCFADDTGLEVDALGGAPGVYSARYAGGQGHDSEANMKKLLSELEHKDNRKARFRTVIALIIDGKVTTFDGIINGTITHEKRGGEGFGYDPIFMPEGHNQTFAELGADIKNHISHRAKAVQKLADYLLKR